MILRSCFHQNQRFALTTIVNAHFWAFWFRSAFWNDVYSKISMDATAFCSNHVWKRWFWPQKLSMNAPRFESAFWNAVYSKSAFWNAVYSKISMDATAFCSNHVWKRWFWPQKLSINAPYTIELCTQLPAAPPPRRADRSQLSLMHVMWPSLWMGHRKSSAALLIVF